MKLKNSDKEIIISNQKSIFLAAQTPRDEETVSWRIEAIVYSIQIG